MNEMKTKFQQLLQELFQFDLADLDFGLYRIMNYKQQVIERWITEDLPRAIEQELRQGALAEQGEAQKALEEARRKVLETLGAAAIDAEGNLAEAYVNTPLGKAYLDAREKAAHAQSSEALEAAVYNHLYAFFSRYYEDGDFISKRRYSKKERYAIPYNGEEVYLYWANHDQYYVKTAEHFTDYTWKAPNGVTVHFKLKAADVEQNNVKGEKRFFLPVLDEMEWQEAARTLTIPFEYRPLTKQEEITHGAKNQQEAILEKARQAIPDRLKKNPEGLAALTAERRKDAKGKPVSYLEHHLRQYTARNTRDFFIHKGLKGFLSRELDFYLKNEVLNLEELEAAGETLSAGWFQLMRLIKRVGNAIIDFLAQIEDFQKALWEKKKFVTETFYVITVGNIPKEFYGEIAECDAQWDEWKPLLRIDEEAGDLFTAGEGCKKKRIEFLESHPALPLDTRHFSQDFTDRLLASFENLDEATDGLLVHSENWQALNLLLEKYRERVKCIYIDPPYNTGNDEFLYRDNYQHSSWLAMMYDRLALGQEYIRKDGSIFVNADDNEQNRLKLLMDQIIGSENFISSVIWEKVHTRKNSARYFSVSHDYLVVHAKSKTEWDRILLPREDVSAYSNPDNDPKGPWKPDPVYANNPYDADYIIVKPNGVKLKPPPGQYWRFSESTFREKVSKGEVLWGQGTAYPMVKRYLSDAQEGLVPVTLFTRDFASDNMAANAELDALFGQGRAIQYPKPTLLVQRVGQITTRPNKGEFILDYFAGSGTTGHAVINLNREDGGRRKFILVEMGEYFDSVLLPRIKKVTFSPEWKDGKPKRPATQEEFERGPRIVKVIRLESYEDALNNIAFDETGGQPALDLFGSEYLLRYMLKWESRKSATLLDVEKLQSPFSYQLHIHRDGETRTQPVDLPETFNYLLGLDVETRKVYADNGRRYLVYRGTLRNGRKAAVLWRETKDWERADYERDATFVVEHNLTAGADDIFVNGDSCIPGAQSLDGLFKARLFGGTEG
ncbi:MAG: site-specific DNA-methyltransferase [Bellilinea sp.]|nr:MAG: site-specific DNA-methyltransferase [Bellilinea sp.]